MAKRKMKTKRAAAKRYKITGTGKIVVSHAGARHLSVGTSRKVMRRLKGTGVIDKADWPMAHSLLPYGSVL